MRPGSDTSTLSMWARKPAARSERTMMIGQQIKRIVYETLSIAPASSGLVFEDLGRPVLKEIQLRNASVQAKLKHLLGRVLVECNGQPVQAESDWLDLVGRAKGELKLRFAAPVRYNCNPRLLGCVLDGQLTFAAQIDAAKLKMQKRNKLMRRMAGTTWGAQRSLLRQLHQGCGQASADFALGVYGSFASASQIARLETEQRRAACIISGCTSTTPQDAALREAELLPMALRTRQHAGIMMERFRLCSEAGTLHTTPEQLLIAPIRAPWEWTAQPSIFPELRKPVSRANNSPAERRQAALDTIAQLPAADVLLSTDGSARRGIEKGGSGWHVCTPSGRAMLTAECAAGRWASSYRCEGIALREGLKALRRALASPASRTPHLQLALECLGVDACMASTMGLSVTAFSDSQGLLKRLRSGPIAQRGRVESEIWDLIEVLWSECKVRLVLQWVPSHTLDDEDFDAANPLSGNRVADSAAERGSKLPQRGRPVDLRSAASAVKRHVREQWAALRPQHWHLESTGGSVPKRHPQRRVERVLANLRTGHCARLQEYRARFCGEDSDLCPKCEMAAGTAKHLFRCPATVHIRQKHLGERWEDPTVLTTHPELAEGFLKEIGIIDTDC
eukprot:gene685-11797_t